MLDLDEMMDGDYTLEAYCNVIVTWNCPHCNHYHEIEYNAVGDQHNCKKCERISILVNYD